MGQNHETVIADSRDQKILTRLQQIVSVTNKELSKILFFGVFLVMAFPASVLLGLILTTGWIPILLEHQIQGELGFHEVELIIGWLIVSASLLRLAVYEILTKL